MKNEPVDVRFWSYRTLWGLLAGIVVALVFIIFFKRPEAYTPTLSLIAASWISKLSQPKHLAGLGAIIAIPAGFVAGVQLVLERISTPDLAGLIGAYLMASIYFVIYLISFSFLGFFYGQLLKLYRKGAIF